MVILNDAKYKEIRIFIRKFKGLAIDCQTNLEKKFPDIPKLTLGLILLLVILKLKL